MVQVVHVRRRVDETQHAVHVERVDRLDEVEALREHDLKDVAVEDVLLGGVHRLRPRGPLEVAAQLGKLVELTVGREGRRVGQWSAEIRNRVVEARDRAVVHRVDGRRVGVGRRVHVLDEVHPLAVMVERRDTPGEGTHRVGKPHVVGRRRTHVLDLPHRVVTHPTHDAAVKWRQVGQGRRAVAREQRVEQYERAAVVGNAVGRRPSEPFDLPAPSDEGARRVAAEEREAAPAFRVLHRLEQEALAVTYELHERRQRRLEIGENVAPDRHDGVVARQGAELVARGPNRERRHKGPGAAPPPKARKKQLCSPVWQAPRPSCSTTNSKTSMSQS